MITRVISDLRRPAAAGVGLAGSALRERAVAHVRVPTGLFLD